MYILDLLLRTSTVFNSFIVLDSKQVSRTQPQLLDPLLPDSCFGLRQSSSEVSLSACLSFLASMICSINVIMTFRMASLSNVAVSIESSTKKKINTNSEWLIGLDLKAKSLTHWCSISQSVMTSTLTRWDLIIHSGSDYTKIDSAFLVRWRLSAMKDHTHETRNTLNSLAGLQAQEGVWVWHLSLSWKKKYLPPSASNQALCMKSKS